MASNSIKFHIERRLSVLFVLGPIDSVQKSTAQNLCTISEFKETELFIRNTLGTFVCPSTVGTFVCPSTLGTFVCQSTLGTFVCPSTRPVIKFRIIIIIKFYVMSLQKFGMNAAKLPRVWPFSFLFVTIGTWWTCELSALNRVASNYE
jgi:hypothetical protein